MSKTIQIRPTVLKYIPYTEFCMMEFNTLKSNENRDISKLKNSILKSQFSSPIITWKNYVIDGTGRKQALADLVAEGYEIPDLPILELEAKNLKEVKKLVLMINSTHGEITQESLGKFTTLDFDLEELKELQLDELDIGALEYLLETLSSDDNILDYSTKNKEINSSYLGNESVLLFKYTHKEYLNVLDLLNNAKEALGCNTNEETLLKLLKDYE